MTYFIFSFFLFFIFFNKSEYKKNVFTLLKLSSLDQLVQFIGPKYFKHGQHNQNIGKQQQEPRHIDISLATQPAQNNGPDKGKDEFK